MIGATPQVPALITQAVDEGSLTTLAGNTRPEASSWSGGGGTSFASPIWAGFQALVNQKRERDEEIRESRLLQTRRKRVWHQRFLRLRLHKRRQRRQYLYLL